MPRAAGPDTHISEKSLQLGLRPLVSADWRTAADKTPDFADGRVNYRDRLAQPVVHGPFPPVRRLYGICCGRPRAVCTAAAAVFFIRFHKRIFIFLLPVRGNPIVSPHPLFAPAHCGAGLRRLPSGLPNPPALRAAPLFQRGAVSRPTPATQKPVPRRSSTVDTK